MLFSIFKKRTIPYRDYSISVAIQSRDKGAGPTQHRKKNKIFA